MFTENDLDLMRAEAETIKIEYSSKKSNRPEEKHTRAFLNRFERELNLNN